VTASQTPAGHWRLLARLLPHISRRRKIQSVFLLGLTLASSFAEVVSLGAIIPFIGALTQPERVFRHESLAPVIRWLGLTQPTDVIVPLTLAFVVAALLAGALRLLLAYVSLRLANATGVDLSVEVYRRTLYQPYAVHVARNSSEIISGITQKVSAVTTVLMSVVNLVTAGFLFLAIMIALLSFDPRVAAASFVCFGAGYGIVIWQSRRRLLRNSQLIAREQTTVVKSLQEGLGAIRDVILDGTHDVYIAAYTRAFSPLQRSIGENIFLGQAPRFAMETLGMVLVAGLAFALTHDTADVGTALPILGALGLGAQRLLPLLQQLYGAWSYVTGTTASLYDVIVLLEQPMPAYVNEPSPPPMKLRDRIEFSRVHFRYGPSGPWVLEDVSFSLPKGGRLGIVGTTGSGKSTLLDLMMALVRPVEGRILVDGQPVAEAVQRSWQRSIAHVPQNIYLADTTIAANIAFGVPQDRIDMDRVRDAARRAQIADFIESRAGGYQAIVGERGVSISGGQRQRIGIARALYKQASVLIFDEATNALDTATEAAVMESIDDLDRELTIIFVAHRLSTLQSCDQVIRIDGGRIVARGDYREMMAPAESVPTENEHARTL
jgi:ATP-binding cassette, subfamily B, bacterial PglK